MKDRKLIILIASLFMLVVAGVSLFAVKNTRFILLYENIEALSDEEGQGYVFEQCFAESDKGRIAKVQCHEGTIMILTPGQYYPPFFVCGSTVTYPSPLARFGYCLKPAER